MIYFDNGATSWPKPPELSGNLVKNLSNYGANPGRSAYKFALSTSEKIYQTRKNIADLFHVENEENVIFSLNATYILNTIIKGVLKPGQRVLISDMEHNAVFRPLMKLKKKIGIQVFTFETDLYDNKKTLRNFENQLKNDIHVVISLHASNVLGRVLPIYEMGQICKKYNCLFIVDACQSVGKIDIDISKCNIDVLCFSPHKGLLSLMGTGVMIVNTENLKIDTLVEGGTGGSSMDKEMPLFLPDRYEAGTLNVPGILSINSGISYIKNKTVERIGSYELSLCQKTYNSLKNISDRIILYTPYPEKDYIGVLSFNIQGISPSEIAQFLDSKNICVRSGLHCSPLAHKKLNTLPEGTVRVSFGPYNTIREIEQFCYEIKKFIALS